MSLPVVPARASWRCTCSRTGWGSCPWSRARMTRSTSGRSRCRPSSSASLRAPATCASPASIDARRAASGLHPHGASQGPLGAARGHPRHALRNALPPILTQAGLDLGFFLGGVVVIEAVIRLAGYRPAGGARDLHRGRAAADGHAARGDPRSIVLANLAADILNALLDPRIRDGLDRGEPGDPTGRVASVLPDDAPLRAGHAPSGS